MNQGFIKKIKRLSNYIIYRMPLPAKKRLVLFKERLSKIKEKKAIINFKYCNICGWQGKRFDVFYNERMEQNEESICPNCNSEPRQRALFKYLRSEFQTTYLYAIREKNLLCLEIAPGLSPVEKALKGIIYISIDLKDSRAMYQMDLTNPLFKDFTFGLVVCSHVLEHIKDDLTAIRQIYRVLEKNGTALIQIPVGYYKDPSGTHTIEFDKIGVCEHVRSYGWDFKEKLAKAGFKVNIIHFEDSILNKKLSIEKEVIFECKK
jgi:hypothetical protein